MMKIVKNTSKSRRFFLICFGYVTMFINSNRVLAKANLNCSNFQGLVKDGFRFLKILAPILLVLFGVLDFAKAVFGDSNEELKKAGSSFIKRLLAAALIFILPTILNMVLGFAIKRGIITGYLRCWV